MYGPRRPVLCPRRDKKTNPPAGSDCGRTWNRLRLLQNGSEVDGLFAGFDIFTLPRHGLAVATCKAMISRGDQSVNPRKTDSRGYLIPAGPGWAGRAGLHRAGGSPGDHRTTAEGEPRPARVENAPGRTAPVGRPPHRERGTHQTPPARQAEARRGRHGPARTCPERTHPRRPRPTASQQNLTFF